MYSVLRPLLFSLDEETSHNLSLGLLKTISHSNTLCSLLSTFYGSKVPRLPCRIMDIRLPNPVGLAAGLDKNAEAVNALHHMGFGWLELGTVTPAPQAGNPRKRLFRITRRCAIINRMGFNSLGVDRFLDNLNQQLPRDAIIGINIGKNANTPIDRAIDDYQSCLEAVFPHADYVAVNISSPNTKDLRNLQQQDQLAVLMRQLKDTQMRLAERHKRYVPLAIKIAPDLSQQEVLLIAELILEQEMDGVIATNTTVTRPNLANLPHAGESGGLSGPPLKALSSRVIELLYRTLQGRVPIIGVGGVENVDDVWEKLQAGADVVQIYTSLIYRGPAIVRELVSGLKHRLNIEPSAGWSQTIMNLRTPVSEGSAS